MAKLTKTAVTAVCCVLALSSVSADEARYTLQDGESLTIQHEDEKIVLTKDSPLAVRPVTKVKRASIPGANP